MKPSHNGHGPSGSGALPEAWLARHALTSRPWLPWLRAYGVPEALGGVGSVLMREIEDAFTAWTGVRPKRLRAADRATPGVRCEIAETAPAGGFTLGLGAGGPVVRAATGEDLLRGGFVLLRAIQSGAALPGQEHHFQPAFPLRLVSQWDNLDGTIERGYAGGSIFDWHDVEQCVGRVADYGRLLASVGINGIVLNNVTAQAEFLEPERLMAVARVAGIFRDHGLRSYLSINSAAPVLVGGLPTADPLDPGVRDWWAAKAAEIYRLIPDFGGFSVKADCEGVPGPLLYGRTHADGANVLARALRPHGGAVLWRTFVYELPRGQTTYDFFRRLDGDFDENVILVVKNGPVDFQPVEPLHPLFGQMPRTRQMAEFQIIQEYTGQTTKVCHLGPYWSGLLKQDTGSGDRQVSLREFLQASGTGVVGVSNIGNVAGWFAHPFNGANLYAFGRLVWDPEADPAAIAREWASLTFGPAREVVDTVVRILLESHPVYVRGTHPFGLPLLTDYDHFRPMPEKRRSHHDAGPDGIGVDRGTRWVNGSVGQYPPRIARLYGDVRACPEEVLLFFHRLPWDYPLADGTPLAEAFDAGIAAYPDVVARWREAWDELRPMLAPPIHHAVAERLAWQLEEARLWQRTLGEYFRECRTAGGGAGGPREGHNNALTHLPLADGVARGA